MESETESWGALSRLPGNPLMWVLIMSELAVFGALVMAFAICRALDPATFRAGQDSLSLALGGFNTLVLVTSGWCAARGVGAGHVPTARRWVAGAMTLGLVFIVVKLVEYGREAEAGHGLNSDTFFTLFFLTTGFHLAHVIAGIVVLGIVARWPAGDNLETGASFWHMVDLVWLIVFPVFYLIR